MLRPAKAEDAAKVEAVLTAAFTEYAQGLGRSIAGPYPWLADKIAKEEVLWIGENHAGVVVIGWSDATLEIDSIAIDPPHQGSGLGGKTLKALEDLAQQHNATSISLYTAQPFSRLVALYSKHGYLVERVGPTPSGKDKIPRIYMRKRVAPKTL